MKIARCDMLPRFGGVRVGGFCVVPGIRGRPGERVFPGPSVKCGCGGVLLSHVLSGIVPSPCQGLASGFGMGPGVSPGPWPPQNLLSCLRVAVREPDRGRE